MPAKKSYKFPHVFVFLFIMIFIMIALTWIIPAGKFDRETVDINGIKQVRVIAGSYHNVAQNPQQIWSIFPALVKGFTESAGMIFMVLFCGGAVGILEKTGAVKVLFQRVVRRVAGKEYFAIFLVMFIMSLGGATGAFSNPCLALVPIGMVLSMAMGFDTFVGFGMIYMGTYAGFDVGWSNVLTVGIAHDIAQLEKFSGFYMRVFFHAVNLALSFGYVAMYARMIKKDRTKSLAYNEGVSLDEIYNTKADAQGQDDPMTWRHIVCMLISVVCFSLIIIGSMQWKWNIPQYSSVFLAMAVLTGLCGGLGPSMTAVEFIKGAGSILVGGFLMGIARAVSIIMVNGNILDSVIYYLSQPITHFGSVAGAILMFIFNTAINIFIPSGSGQAVAVMPTMIPIADLTGITRQVAVQAFQFGDGLSNSLFPTAAVSMSALAIVKTPFDRFFKWFLPLFIVKAILACVALAILQSMNWQG
jgi:uncharacterized ion transporter superfamily protein YfcC